MWGVGLAVLLAQAPVVEAPKGRQDGDHLGIDVAAGLSVLAGVEYAHDWEWVGLYVLAGVEFQWPLLFARAPFLGGGDLGVRVHLGRRFSLGVGGLAAMTGSGLTFGVSATPAMVHLGGRGQHTIWAYVPLRWQLFGDTFGGRSAPPVLTVFPMLGYRYTFF